MYYKYVALVLIQLSWLVSLFHHLAILVHILADLAYQPKSLTNPIEDPVINARQYILFVVAFWTINAT